MQYRVEQHPLGWFQHAPGGVATGSVTVSDIDPASVPELRAEIERQFGNDVQVMLHVDDRERDARLTGALAAAGFEPAEGSTFLAYTGEPPTLPSLLGVTIGEVDADGLERWARVKLQGFANSEDEPDPRRFAQELAQRRAEQQGSGRFLLATARSEDAAVIGLWGDEDWLISNLATRLPYRRLRLAELLLSDVVDEAIAAPVCRSVLIDTDETDWMVEWYRRFGFTDEVHWRRRYNLLEAD
jgi:GNAT superfamily N-acetyltransferase